MIEKGIYYVIRVAYEYTVLIKSRVQDVKTYTILSKDENTACDAARELNKADFKSLTNYHCVGLAIIKKEEIYITNN